MSVLYYNRTYMCLKLEVLILILLFFSPNFDPLCNFTFYCSIFGQVFVVCEPDRIATEDKIHLHKKK